MTHVFRRVLTRELPRAVRAEGVWITDAEGKRYLDGAGGAIVMNVGHGDRVAPRRDGRARRDSVQYVHGTMFTTERARGVRRRRRHRPADGRPEDLPGLGRQRGRRDRAEARARRTSSRAARIAALVIGRKGAYHGNTFGALDVGRQGRDEGPYLPWLGRFRHVEAAYEYRCTMPGHPVDCGARHADALEAAIARARARERRRVHRRAGRRARRSPPPSRPTTTGRPSPRCAAATACS